MHLLSGDSCEAYGAWASAERGTAASSLGLGHGCQRGLAPASLCCRWLLIPALITLLPVSSTLGLDLSVHTLSKHLLPTQCLDPWIMEKWLCA